MSSALEQAAESLRIRLAGADFDGTARFDIEDEGVIRITGGEVSIADGHADVTIAATLDTFREIFEGTLSPAAAYMTGRMRIDGDMGAAMKLSRLLG